MARRQCVGIRTIGADSAASTGSVPSVRSNSAAASRPNAALSRSSTGHQASGGVFAGAQTDFGGSSDSARSTPLSHRKSASLADDAAAGDSSVSSLIDLKKEIIELKLCIDKAEKERDFYFCKLREVEIMCQENEADPLSVKILDALYSTN